MNPIRIAAVAALVLAAAALAGVGLPEQARSDEGAPARGITVTASGKVESIPDRAALEIGVETQAGSAKSALGQNADRLADVIDACTRPASPRTTCRRARSTCGRNARATATG